MKVEYQDNKELPPGNGILIFSDDLFPDGPWSISIQRSSDQKFLTGKSAGQWVGETTQIPASAASLDGKQLKMELAPAVVDSLDQKDQYKVILKGEDNVAHPGRLKIGAIAHSMGASLDNTARIAEKPTAPTPPPPPPLEKPAPAEKAKVETPLEMASASPASPDKRRRWVLPLLALLALFCLAWWYFDPRGQQAKSPEKSTPPAPVASQRPAATPQNTGALPDAERAVREFFAGSNLTPVNALALARSLPNKTPAERDAIYRLYYYAATSENPDGFLEYGQCLDPSTPAWGTIEKNGVEAWQVYQKARAKDGNAAEAALEKLRKWLEEQATAGNSKAVEWLGSIKK